MTIFHLQAGIAILIVIPSDNRCIILFITPSVQIDTGAEVLHIAAGTRINDLVS